MLYFLENRHSERKRRACLSIGRISLDTRNNEILRLKPLNDGLFSYNGFFWYKTAVILVLFSLSSFTNPIGDWYVKEYHPNGKMKKEGWLLKKQKTAYWYCYFPNGKIMDEGFYKNNTKNGFWKIYFSNGIVKAKGSYTENKKNGWWINNYETNLTKSIGKYSNNKKNGWWKYYHQNGKIESSINYQNGKKNGWVSTFSKKSEITSIGKYDLGKKDYFWKYYSRSKLIKKEAWSNGVLNWKINFRYNSPTSGLFNHYKNNVLVTDGSFEIKEGTIIYFDKKGGELYKQAVD